MYNYFINPIDGYILVESKQICFEPDVIKGQKIGFPLRPWWLEMQVSESGNYRLSSLREIFRQLVFFCIYT